MRERTDKSFPNAEKTARAVLESIMEPVTETMLLEYIAKHAYKEPMPPPNRPPPVKRPRPSWVHSNVFFNGLVPTNFLNLFWKFIIIVIDIITCKYIENETFYTPSYELLLPKPKSSFTKFSSLN